jgi:acetyltransferase-like isoleucine patch superfamily enzyme
MVRTIVTLILSTPAPACRDSHRSLLRPVPAGSATLDAIVVPATRPAKCLTTAAELGERLGALVVVLCSRSARADDFAALTLKRPGLRWLAVDLPTGYDHDLFDFATARVEEVKARRLGDLTVKRNLGLVLAKLLGWTSVLFLDDDIESIDAADVSRGAAALGELHMVGLEVSAFPDNSVVCHANRIDNDRQETFVTGSALLVDTCRVESFFPEVYNEDWLFFFHSVRQRRVGRIGEAKQSAYEPFADPDRAVGEEFGDVFAEGLMELAHLRKPPSAADDPAYWACFLTRRARFIEQIATRVESLPASKERLSALVALRAAESRRAEITPDSYAAYLRTWSGDLPLWATRMNDIRPAKSISAALQSLDLATVSQSPEKAELHRKGTPMALNAVKTHPAARIAPTAQIGAPYRHLQDGDWTQLNRSTSVGARCDIGHFCFVGEEAQIGAGSILDTYCMVEGGATLGEKVILTHRASVGARAWIGDGSVIGCSLVCERSRVGKGCRVFGDLVHRQLDPTIPWDAPEGEETSPTLGDNVFVGWGATIIGGVNIGDGAYICAGATVTKDVPAHQIVTGTNNLHSPGDWNGSLGKSDFFRSGNV